MWGELRDKKGRGGEGREGKERRGRGKLASKVSAKTK